MPSEFPHNPRISVDALHCVSGPPSGSDPSRWTIMKQIREEASAGHYGQALEIARGDAAQNPLVANAMGVCLLRMGRISEAVAVYRALLLTPGATTMRPDRPLYFKLNYATALLLWGQPEACLEVLQDIEAESDTAERLREAIKRWETGLSFGQKLDWWINRVAPPGRRIMVDFAPGDFGPVESPGEARSGPPPLSDSPAGLRDSVPSSASQ